ncbi:hypothetical protein ACHAWF_002809 [Thalassiosira exigua]
MASAKRSRGNGVAGRRLTRGSDPSSFDDGLLCANCRQSIPFLAEYAELSPCLSPVCLKCLAALHARRGAHLLRFRGIVVSSHRIIGAERNPTSERLAYNLDEVRRVWYRGTTISLLIFFRMCNNTCQIYRLSFGIPDLGWASNLELGPRTPWLTPRISSLLLIPRAALEIWDSGFTFGSTASICAKAMHFVDADAGIVAGSTPTGIMGTLPDGALAHVSSYLGKTTRALLATALTAPSTSWEAKCGLTVRESIPTSNASKVVLGPPYYHERAKVEDSFMFQRSLGRPDRSCMNKKTWDVLHFEDVEESVATRLTDGDICGVLVCIDAVNNLKFLKLSLCVNVRGHGLAPLRGSVVCERADLSITSVELERSTGRRPILSIDATLPILQSVVSKVGNSMTDIHLPSVWYEFQSEILCQHLGYLARESLRHIYGLSLRDSICNDQNAITELGTTLFNCTTKLKMDCEACTGVDNHDSSGRYLKISCESICGLSPCSCDRKFCDKCVAKDFTTTMEICGLCQNNHCDDCGLFYCDCCSRYLCEHCTTQLHCSNDCDNFLLGTNCEECAFRGGTTKWCIRCNENYCDDCRDMQFVDHLDGNVCVECQNEERDGVQEE